VSTVLAEDGDFPDVEAMAMEMLSAVVVNGQPLGTRTGTRTPAQIDGPFIHVVTAPAGGGLNPGGWQEVVNLYVATWADDRPTSRQMRSEVRRIFADYVDGGDYRGILIDRAWESSAPGPVPVFDEDDRRIESGWAFRVRRHRGATVTAA
jgi:hypothetical protein